MNLGWNRRLPWTPVGISPDWRLRWRRGGARARDCVRTYVLIWCGGTPEVTYAKLSVVCSIAPGLYYLWFEWPQNSSSTCATTSVVWQTSALHTYTPRAQKNQWQPRQGTVENAGSDANSSVTLRNVLGATCQHVWRPTGGRNYRRSQLVSYFPLLAGRCESDLVPFVNSHGWSRSVVCDRAMFSGRPLAVE